mgnify:CR=1 FL=1
MMRGVVLAALLLAASAEPAAQTVRCESPGGKVTYANTACPDGATAVRTLPPAEPPSPADARAARERLKADQKQVQALDREREAEDKAQARRRAAAAAAREKREAACRKLAQQVAEAEADLSRAALNKREPAERRLQRARARESAECPAS